MAKRILIADDHRAALRGIRALLDPHPGWQVCGEAMGGRDAVTKAVELRPDLVVLDFAMPQVDGLKAASEINSLLPEIQIVLHTMYGSAVRAAAEKHGISRLVEKAKSGALVAAVEELLGTDKPEPTAQET
jgi:DNA-binding NarL/FixJ family response regulator